MKKPSLPRTRAELTSYAETSRHADVVAFCDALAAQSPLVHRTSIGQSGEGQDIVALVLSDRKAFTPELARRQKKAIVMIEANIHAGEVEGKEEVLALARDLALTSRGKGILDRICLVVIPDFNPDGNDRVSPENRKLDVANLEGQVNPPGGVGMRYTGQGFNLNRDNMKQEAPETRHLARFYQHFWPDLFIDCHTTDGSIHGFDLTFDCSHGNHAFFEPVRAYNRRLLSAVAENVEKRHRVSSYWYGNFLDESDPRAGWQTYPALPRFGSHYRGLLGRLDVLLETYSYLPFERRCRVMGAWLLELCRYSAKNARALRDVTRDAEAAIERHGRSPDATKLVAVNHGIARRDASGALLFDYPAFAAVGDIADVRSFDLPSLAARAYPGKKRVRYRVPHRRTFVPTAAVSMPHAYLAPAMLAERLLGHGITFSSLATPAEMPVESYLILAREQTFSPDVAAEVPALGQAEVPLSARPKIVRFETVLTVRAEKREVRVPAGTLVVPTAQRAGVLAMYLLEPHSDDGFARWQFLDALLEVGQLYPVHRLVEEPRAPAKQE
ncbi:MAG TPA: M14 family zinc carboxypeptidase [Polyangiaceae bacterium]|nr:M14 family zinc carboxypeptidase [Polyangiaceae bacterium]